MPPVNNNFADATELNLVGQQRRIRSVAGTTVGSTTETDEPLTKGDFEFNTITGTVWYRLSADANTTGVFRLAIPGTGDLPGVGVVMWRQNGDGFGGLQHVADGANLRTGGLHNNCEGHEDGQDNALLMWALGGGEEYYLQVAAFEFGHSVEADFTLEWCYDPLPEPTLLVGTKSSCACPGPALDTHGWHIAYYDSFYGWPAYFLPGRRVSGAPLLPTWGHAFYVEEAYELGDVFYRRLVLGWTEDSGPFLYGYLDAHGWLREWRVDGEDPNAPGASDAAGGMHMSIHFYDNKPAGESTGGEHPTDTFRSITGEGDTNPTYTWGPDLTSVNIESFAWGGTGRPGSYFAWIITDTGRYVLELDLDGNIVRTIQPRTYTENFVRCSLDGTEVFGIGLTGLEAVNVTTGSIRTVKSPAPGYAVLGVRSTDGHIVLAATTLFSFGAANRIVVVNPSTGVSRTLVLPTSPEPGSSGGHWGIGDTSGNMGVTADGQHLFLSAFYPLSDPVPDLDHPGHDANGRRDFITDVWWIDLDTGAAERKFILAHPYHDTYMVPDRPPFAATSLVAGVRLYRQADIGR